VRATRLIAYALLAVVLAGVAGIGVHFWERGYRVYVIHTGSMMPTFNPGGVVIDRPAGRLHVGEPITFLHSGLSSDLVTHRVKTIHSGYLTTKGDANRTADPWQIRPDQVRGAVSSYVPDLGYVLIFFKQPSGVAAVMTGALAIILLWGLFFPEGLADPKPMTIDDAFGATTEAALTGIPQLRGRHRAPRTGTGAVEALRKGHSVAIP
jgi:signal peptidase